MITVLEEEKKEVENVTALNVDSYVILRMYKMGKHKLRYGYETIQCPMCKSKTFDYCSYSEYGWGIVEQHGFCTRCGYVVEQAYSPVIDAFIDTKKGFKNRYGEYTPKDIKRHKRIRRKLNIKNIDVNPRWVFYT